MKVPDSVQSKYQEKKETEQSSRTPKRKKAKKTDAFCETPSEWATHQTIFRKPEFSYFYPLLVDLAEINLSAPLTYVWPQRGVSAINTLKPRLHNRLNNILHSLLQITINGPSTFSPAANNDIKKSAEQ